jgi:uncharacterized protein YvpB
MEKQKPTSTRDMRMIIAIVLLISLVAIVSVLSLIKKPSAASVMKPTTPVAVTLNATKAVSPSLTTSITTITITPTPTPENTEPTPTYTPFVLPESHYLMIDADKQYFALGCEASAAVDLAEYYDILIYQYNFQHELPLSDNPDLGFVGDAKGPWGQVPPYAYGVHAAPVADLLQTYGLDVEGGKGYSLELLKTKIASGHPVIVWVIGNMVGGVPAEYIDREGNKTLVAAYEHVVILTGFDQDSIRYVNNGRFFEVPNEVFLNSWGVLGNMAVFHR